MQYSYPPQNSIKLPFSHFDEKLWVVTKQPLQGAIYLNLWIKTRSLPVIIHVCWFLQKLIVQKLRVHVALLIRPIIIFCVSLLCTKTILGLEYIFQLIMHRGKALFLYFKNHDVQFVIHHPRIITRTESGLPIFHLHVKLETCGNFHENIVETSYNEVLGTRKVCLLYQIFCYISSK